LHRWKENVTAVAKKDTGHHNAGAKINQRLNRLSTKNRAMHKQQKWNQKWKNQHQQATIMKTLKLRVKDGQDCTINYTNKKI
jgi:hypothetical protein